MAALEILLDTPRVKDLIKKGEADTLKEALEQGTNEGCQTFDESLFRLARDGRIEAEEALAHADSANNLRLRLRNEEMARGQAEQAAPTFRMQGVPPPRKSHAPSSKHLTATGGFQTTGAPPVKLKR